MGVLGPAGLWKAAQKFLAEFKGAKAKGDGGQRKAGFTDLDIGMTLVILEKEREPRIDITRYVGKRVNKNQKDAETDLNLLLTRR